MTRTSQLRSLVLLVLGAGLLVALLHSLYFVGVAHADPASVTAAGSVQAATTPDPVAAVTAGYDAGLAVWTQHGPLWAGLVVMMLVLRTFLDRQHWLQQGRLLTGLTGLGAVIAAVLQWHFSGAPAAGIITAIVGALVLLHHPTVTATSSPTTSRTPQAGRARLTVLVLIALGAGIALPALSSSGCTAAERQTAAQHASAGGGAYLDCTAPDLAALVADLLPLGKEAILALISGDGHADATKLKSDMANAKGDLARCLIAGAIGALVVPARQQPGAPAAAELQVDRAGLLDAFGGARRELGWGPVVLPGGQVL